MRSIRRAQAIRPEVPESTPTPAEPPAESAAPEPAASADGRAVARIGRSIRIRGDLRGQEDLVLDGHVEGRVELPDHHLTIGPNTQHIQAQLEARSVTIHGHVVGDVLARGLVEITGSGRVDGDVVAPRLAVREGAQLNGRVHMTQGAAAAERPGRARA